MKIFSEILIIVKTRGNTHGWKIFVKILNNVNESKSRVIAETAHNFELSDFWNLRKFSENSDFSFNSEPYIFSELSESSDKRVRLCENSENSQISDNCLLG